LIDLTAPAPHVFAFGVKNACNEYQSSTWSHKRRSVVTIHDNIHFFYFNGTLVPPDPDKSDEFKAAVVTSFHKLNSPITPFAHELPLASEGKAK
jgi:hypothetical protein